MSDVKAPESPERDVLAGLSDTDLWHLDIWAARHSQPLPANPVTWSRPSGTTVADSEQLTHLIGGLALQQFGVLASGATSNGRWAQVYNVAEAGEESSYIVEVHNGAESDFAQRVFKGIRNSDYPPSPDGRRLLHDFEVFSAARAANIAWSWLHIGLPVGYLRTENQMGPAELRRYGRA
jgi:hypothetical protein